jgi:hypothetical protein
MISQDESGKKITLFDVIGWIFWGTIAFICWNASDGCSCSKRSIDDGGSTYDEPFVPR